MAMQSARYLIKTYKNLHKGFKATNPVMKYLNNAEKLLTSKCPAQNAE
jgi:hypothetical protein